MKCYNIQFVYIRTKNAPPFNIISSSTSRNAFIPAGLRGHSQSQLGTHSEVRYVIFLPYSEAVKPSSDKYVPSYQQHGVKHNL